MIPSSSSSSSSSSSLFQIYCQLPDTLQLKFPGSTTKVFSALSFVNLSSISAGSPQCYTSFDYVDKLLMTTLTPICIEIVVCICFLAHIAYKSRAGWHPGDFGAIVSTYVSFFLVVSYLVLPSVSTTIFGSFNCVSVDPEHLVPGLPKYLRLDYSISCDSPRWVFLPSLLFSFLGFSFPMCYFFSFLPLCPFRCIRLTSHTHVSTSRLLTRLNPYLYLFATSISFPSLFLSLYSPTNQ